MNKNKINLHFKITDVKKYSKSIEENELNPDEARSEIFPAIWRQPEHPI